MNSSQHPLFVGSYAATDQPGIHGFAFDAATGALTPHGTFAGITNPSFLVAHPRRPWLYAVSETSESHDGVAGAVWALRFEREPWRIQALNSRPSGGSWPCHLCLDRTSKWLLVSNYGDGSAGVLPLLTDGTLGEMTDRVQHHGRSVNDQRQEGPHAHSTILTPDNRFAIVADLGLDQLVMYAFDAVAGKLAPHRQVAARPGAGPRHMAFHPSGGLLYVANELDSTLTVYNYDAAGAVLREQQTITTLPATVPENLVADIHVAPAGDRIYVSNRGHNSLAVFDIATDGRLTHVATRDCGGAWPRNFALAPGGFMLAANQHSGDVAVLPLLRSSEVIGTPIAHVAVAQASCVQFGSANE